MNSTTTRPAGSIPGDCFKFEFGVEAPARPTGVNVFTTVRDHKSSHKLRASMANVILILLSFPMLKSFDPTDQPPIQPTRPRATGVPVGCWSQAALAATDDPGADQPIPSSGFVPARRGAY